MFEPHDHKAQQSRTIVILIGCLISIQCIFIHIIYWAFEKHRKKSMYILQTVHFVYKVFEFNTKIFNSDNA